MSTHISISSIIVSPAIEIKPPKTANLMMNTGLAPNIFFADNRHRVCLTCIAERRKEARHAYEPCRHSHLGLLIVEGENDDISGIGEIHAGQTCQTLPQLMKANYL
jgi:PHB de-polymerase C-terminus